MLQNDQEAEDHHQREPVEFHRSPSVTPPGNVDSRPFLPFLVDTILEEHYPPAETVPLPRDLSIQSDLQVATPGSSIPDRTNPRLRLLTPKARAKDLDKPWHDMRLFTPTFWAPCCSDADTFANFQNNTPVGQQVDGLDGQPEHQPDSPSRTARRLSLIPDGSVDLQESYPNEQHRRRNSLTPLSYFSELDSVEQFVEQAAVTPAEQLPEQLVLPPAPVDGDPTAQPQIPVEMRASAEHFLVPRHSICAGIKIEITPPSAIREVNNFILDTVIIEVPDDDHASFGYSPDEMNCVVNIQQLASSSAELRTITPVLSVASVIQNPSSHELPTGPTLLQPPPPPTAEASSDVSLSDSAAVLPPPIRRRTKLIAINVRRQTLSAVPRVQKTVRFAPSPTRGIEYLIDETESSMPDRHPYLFTEAHTEDMETADQLETESEEPFTPGLLRVYDFSTKELHQIIGGMDAKFTDERTALRRFFEAKLVGVPAIHLDALDRTGARRNSTSTDVDMQEA